MTYPRSSMLAPEQSGFYHCVSRCVRRAFLCGEDTYTGQSFEHRKQWVEDRIFALGEVFAVAIYGYAVMSNHLHIVLQLDPSAANAWSDEEVAQRWCQLFPRADATETAQEIRILSIIKNPERLQELRSRLGNLSWFMRCLNEPIARWANEEDLCTGRFWEGRFKSQILLDDRAVLAAMAYVDLNPVRAGITPRLDHSHHTSIKHRIKQIREKSSFANKPLAPIAGLKQFMGLGIKAAQYIELVDWTGRQLRPDKRGAIPKTAPRALQLLHCTDQRWTTQVKSIESNYYRAIGESHDLIDKAIAIGQLWFKGLSFAKKLEML